MTLNTTTGKSLSINGFEMYDHLPISADSNEVFINYLEDLDMDI